MTRIVFVYGILAGAVIIASVVLGVALGAGNAQMAFPEWAGYVIMLAALTLIFIGVKRYRDVEQGGVIRFLPALGVGLAIAAVASVIYVAGWEVYLWSSGYTFFDTYAKSMIAAKQAHGAAPSEIAKLTADMAAMSRQYSQPLARMAITLFEILPVGVVVALISAALLRMRGFLPAHKVAG